MSVQASHSSRRIGWWLVVAQFALIALLIGTAWRAPLPNPEAGIFAAILAVGGLLLFGLTAWVNKPGNWSVHPEPLQTGQLIMAGPYRTIRHPMYTAVLMVALAVILWTTSVIAVVTTVLLLIVLVAKMRLEDRLLQARFGSTYQAYMTSTHRIVPGIW